MHWGTKLLTGIALIAVVMALHFLNRPRAVPQLVSGVRSESGLIHLLIGSDVSENAGI